MDEGSKWWLRNFISFYDNKRRRFKDLFVLKYIDIHSTYNVRLYYSAKYLFQHLVCMLFDLFRILYFVLTWRRNIKTIVGREWELNPTVVVTVILSVSAPQRLHIMCIYIFNLIFLAIKKLLIVLIYYNNQSINKQV